MKSGQITIMKYLKHKIKEIPYIGHFFISVYKYLAPDLQSLIVKYISNHQVIILQIGSNDGKTGDPLFSMICDNKNWNAIFVEPVPYLFKRLKENYGGDPRFNFENIAINEGKEQIFYSVNHNANELLSDLPFWYDQLGSFNRDNIMNHLDGILEPFIEETKLEGVTLMGLLDKYSIKKLDILHIDTEGYDWEILKQLPLNKFYQR